MDTELMTSILALLTGAWTLFQEIRHRKSAKKAKASDLMPAKRVNRGPK